MRDLSNRLETCNIQKREVECSGHSHGFLFLYRNFQSPIRTEYGDEAKGSADMPRQGLDEKFLMTRRFDLNLIDAPPCHLCLWLAHGSSSSAPLSSHSTQLKQLPNPRTEEKSFATRFNFLQPSSPSADSPAPRCTFIG
jgi:hypothetical protein